MTPRFLFDQGFIVSKRGVFTRSGDLTLDGEWYGVRFHVRVSPPHHKPEIWFTAGEEDTRYSSWRRAYNRALDLIFEGTLQMAASSSIVSTGIVITRESDEYQSNTRLLVRPRKGDATYSDILSTEEIGSLAYTLMLAYYKRTGKLPAQADWMKREPAGTVDASKVRLREQIESDVDMALRDMLEEVDPLDETPSGVNDDCVFCDGHCDGSCL